MILIPDLQRGARFPVQDRCWNAKEHWRKFAAPGESQK
jgi:hypothetical protein